jgi:hypothetical protein
MAMFGKNFEIPGIEEDPTPLRGESLKPLVNDKNYFLEM